MRVSGSKDVREEAAHLERLGFRYQGFDSAGHHVFDHALHGELVMAGSPSSYRWRLDHRKTVAKAMGVNLAQVEALIHGQPVGKRTKRPAGRKRSRPPVARHLYVAPEALAAPPVPEPVAVEYAPTDPIDSARRAQWAALQGEYVREHLRNPYPWPSTRRAA